MRWLPEGWWRLVSGGRRRDQPPERVARRHLEVALFTQLVWGLKAGDLVIDGGSADADPRDHLVSKAEFIAARAAYGQQAG